MTAAALTPRLLHGLSDLEQQILRVDGTAVVVDISGFTTLSEQLAAAGREGTEQLIATLSRIFTVLLPATDDGGDVVKFAGDALFLLFTGDQHARHAVHAAWNMNRVLTAIGDIHLPLARAKLRMSVGVHSGTFEFVLTGDQNVSAILTGGATSRVLELQSAAEAGRILVSDETAAVLPAAQVAAAEGVTGAHRLLRAGSVATASLMALSVGRTDAAERFLPRAFAERPDLLGAEPDHRWAAIAFVQVSGLPDSVEPEDLERMSLLTALVEQTAADTGVTLLDVDPAPGGYRYFLTAGAPTTVEDPEGRLITAVLRIVQNAQSGSLVRAGVTSGRVFAGFVGASFRQTYTVMGDPTNLAARLTARAEPGGVLVTRSALERSGRAFETVDGGEITVKGKAQSIPVVAVTGAAAAGALDALSAFIARESELAQLREVLDAAERGVGGVVTVSGPAGIGKSRLVAHALEATELPILRAHGDRYGISTAYSAVSSLLRPLLDIPIAADAATAGAMLTAAATRLDPQLVPWLPLLAPAVSAAVPTTPEVDALDDAFRSERATAVIGELIELLTTRNGCLVLEDAQWIDPASAGVLSEVIRNDRRHGVVIVRRDETGGLELDGRTIALGPFSDDDTADLIEGIAGRRLLPADLRPLVRRSGGNPLYAIELAAGLATGRDALAIEQLVGERIDALSEADRTTLRRASVLGTRIPLGLYVRCVGVPMISGELATMLELGVDGVSFRSELFRDVAYAQLNFQAKRELHRAAAAAIEADRSAAGATRDAMLAHHYQAAGDWGAAREAAVRAAENAERAFALEEAVHAYRVAVEAARREPAGADDLPELLTALGRVSLAGGWAQEGLDAFSHARKLVTDAVERARLDRERAFALNVLGRPVEAVRALRAARRGVAGVGDAAQSVLAAVAVTESGLRLRQGKWQEARSLAQESIGILAGHTLEDDAKGVLADAYRYHDIASGELEGDQAIQYTQLSLELYDQIGDELSKSKVYNLLGARAYYRGEWSLAIALYSQAQLAAESAGDVVGAAIESVNAAEVLVDQGRVLEARPRMRDTMRVFEASDNPYLIAIATAFSARGHLRAGDPDAARADFTRAAELFSTLDDNDWARDNRIRLAETELDDGEVDAARTILDGIGDEATGAALSRLLRQRARLARRDGDPDAAAALTREAMAAASALPYERALSMAQLARWSEPPDDALAAEAERILTGLGVVDLEPVLAASSDPSAGAGHGR
ncbi:AAA family ATPase [Microbacterium jejuense]|uniref:AAA family ATPase n=1 Tax=Microbacterium jejuense TaxID=1263637 RepID=UPI0031E7DF06